MTFHIRGLDPARFTHLHAMDEAELARHRARRSVADGYPGFPCRVSLDDAQPGEAVLLVNFEHHAADTPYRASHAIYVRAGATTPFEATGEVPPALGRRLLSVRAFDAAGFMVSGEIVEGARLAHYLEERLGDANVAYLHAHFAGRGCFAARIDRAP